MLHWVSSVKATNVALFTPAVYIVSSPSVTWHVPESSFLGSTGFTNVFTQGRPGPRRKESLKYTEGRAEAAPLRTGASSQGCNSMVTGEESSPKQLAPHARLLTTAPSPACVSSVYTGAHCVVLSPPTPPPCPSFSWGAATSLDGFLSTSPTPPPLRSP